MKKMRKMNRLLSVLLCACLLLSAAACGRPDPDPDAESNSESESMPAPEPAFYRDYGEIVAEYESLLTAKHQGKELSAPDSEGMSEREKAISQALFGIVDGYQDATSAESLGYGYKDVDGNGIPELILLTQYTSIKAIFTLSDNLPILLEANYGVGSSFVFASRGRFFTKRSTDTDETIEFTYTTCRVDGDKMVYDAVYGQLYDTETKAILEYFQVTDGERRTIDQDAFNELYREQLVAHQVGYVNISKLLAPRIHYPLKETPSNEDLPVADFSSYGAICKTYQKISTCLDKIESHKWFSGEYDNLFAFPNDLSYEYYARLLYGKTDHVGYDEIDLNGDGQDELVLLREDYLIKAIFTMKDGVPVLLDAFAGQTC